MCYGEIHKQKGQQTDTTVRNGKLRGWHFWRSPGLKRFASSLVSGLASAVTLTEPGVA